MNKSHRSIVLKKCNECGCKQICIHKTSLTVRTVCGWKCFCCQFLPHYTKLHLHTLSHNMCPVNVCVLRGNFYDKVWSFWTKLWNTWQEFFIFVQQPMRYFCFLNQWKYDQNMYIKFVYSEKATKFCEISPLLLSTVHTDKSKGEISQNFVAFSEYMNFIKKLID